MPTRIYTTEFMCALFEEEGSDLFDVRQAILGHLQQGGDPSPFDRIQATRLARPVPRVPDRAVRQGGQRSAFIGLQNGQIQFHDMRDFERMVGAEFQRPREQWWLELKAIASLLAQHGPGEIESEAPPA